jgi:hypothetical protein
VRAKKREDRESYIRLAGMKGRERYVEIQSIGREARKKRKAWRLGI